MSDVDSKVRKSKKMINKLNLESFAEPISASVASDMRKANHDPASTVTARTLNWTRVVVSQALRDDCVSNGAAHYCIRKNKQYSMTGAFKESPINSAAALSIILEIPTFLFHFTSQSTFIVIIKMYG